MWHRLSPGTCMNLSQCAVEKPDALALLNLPAPDHHDFLKRLDTVGEEAVNGLLPEIASKWRASGGHGIDPLFAEMMAHVGIDVDVVAHLARVTSCAVQLWCCEGPDRNTCSIQAGGAHDYVIVPGVGRWMGPLGALSGRLQITQPLPATIMAHTLHGRPLSAVVEHPVLDRHAMTVSLARPMPHDVGIELELVA